MKKGKQLMIIAAGSMMLTGCIGIMPPAPLFYPDNQKDLPKIDAVLDYEQLKAEGVEKIRITYQDETCETNLCASEFDSRIIEKFYSNGNKITEEDFEEIWKIMDDIEPLTPKTN